MERFQGCTIQLCPTLTVVRYTHSTEHFKQFVGVLNIMLHSGLHFTTCTFAHPLEVSEEIESERDVGVMGRYVSAILYGSRTLHGRIGLQKMDMPVMEIDITALMERDIILPPPHHLLEFLCECGTLYCYGQ